MSEARGIVLLGADKTIQAQAKRAKLPVTIGELGPPPFEKTLFVAPGTEVPWDLLPAAWHFLERWDAAVPLWRYGVNAEDVGTPSERKRTEKIVRDLRVLLHSHELLFVRDNEAGRALMAAFVEEAGEAGEQGSRGAEGREMRLAFLRALYRVKPRLCVLPRSWLAAVQERSRQDARAREGKGTIKRRKAKTRTERYRGRARGKTLVAVEVAPGVSVQCHKGDEEQVKALYAERRRKRRVK